MTPSRKSAHGRETAQALARAPSSKQSGTHPQLPPVAALAALSRVEEGVWVCDAERRSVWQNAAMQSLANELEPGGALGSLLDPARPASDGEAVFPDGRGIRWSVEPLALAPGSAGFVFVFHDDSSRHALAESEGRLRLLSTHTEGILFELDPSARFVRVWTSDPALLAKPESELLGRTLVEVLGDEVGRWHHDKVCTTLSTGVDQEYDYELEVPSGRRHFACSAIAVHGSDNARSAIFWIRDTTEEVEMRAKLMHSERLASIGVLAAGVAHEINNPLAYMLLNLDRIETVVAAHSASTALAELSGPLRMVREGMQRVRRIVADLLDFSKIGAASDRIDLHHALDVSIDAASPEIAPRALLVKHYGETPAVHADEARLVQVFTNLILNAAQAIPEGNSLRHRIEVVTSRDASGAANVEIRDSGVGIAERLLPKIFEPFFTTKTTGTGLGLSICQRIIQAFGGNILVDSQEGRGTTVRVVLPAARES